MARSQSIVSVLKDVEKFESQVEKYKDAKENLAVAKAKLDKISGPEAQKQLREDRKRRLAELQAMEALIDPDFEDTDEDTDTEEFDEPETHSSPGRTRWRSCNDE
jgi:hypothetical protein